MNSSKKGLTKAMRSGDSIIRAESREPRAESREPRAESREPRAESREPRAESREPRAESREPRAESREPRAESREPRAESREPRAESHGAAMSAPRASRGDASQSDSQPSAAPAGARLSDAPHPTARRFAASHSRHRSRNTGARRAAAGLLLACAALVATSAPVDAQTPTTFVSNIGQNDGNLASVNTGLPRAQQFTTGSNISGYTLTEITVNIGFASSSAVPIFSIYTSVDGVDTATGTTIDVPGSKVVDLTGSVATTGEQSFTPTSTTTLSGSTKYFVVFDTTSGTAYGRYTGSNSVDAGAAAGWDIADDTVIKVSATADWSPSSNRFEIAVKGIASAPPVQLVSNLDQPKYGFGPLKDYDLAQAFTTGANGGGYTLTSVEIALYNATDTAFPGTVSIWNESSVRRPDSSMGTLTNPSSLSPMGTCKVLPCPEAAYQFTSSSGIVLDASATYFVVIDADSSGASVVNTLHTLSDRQDSGGAARWSIGNGSLYRSRSSSGAWTNSMDSKRIRINGLANPTSGANEVWSATLTVEASGSTSGCNNDSALANCSSSSVLSDDEFSYNGTSYAFDTIAISTNSGNFGIAFDTALADGAAQLTLVVDGTTFAFVDADTKSTTSRIWNSAGLSWPDGQEVSLSLRAPLPVVTIEAVSEEVAFGVANAAQFRLRRTGAVDAPLRTVCLSAKHKPTLNQNPLPCNNGFGTGERTDTFSHLVLDEDDNGDPICEVTFEVRPGTGYAVASPSEATVTVKGPGAICTSTGNLRIADPLTASFDGLPQSHDGESAFSFQIEFSEDIDAEAAEMRDHALTVTGGSVTGAARVDGRADRWTFTVAPSVDGSVSIMLLGGRACSEAGAICTGTGGQLSNGLLSLILYVAAVSQSVPAALTASFSGVPDKHTGKSFTFGLAFSENVAGLSYKTLRDSAFSVTNGQVRRARRKTKGSSQSWRITVKPDSSGAVTIRLPATTNCEADDAICTSDARRLSNSPSATIPGAAAALDFAHFAKGATITSEMVLVNAASHPSRPAIYFYDTKGDPIPAESVVDLTGDLEVTEDGALTVRTEMEPLAELTISTHGRGELVTGSVTVLSDGPIGGVVRYSVPEIGVAGVGPGQPTSDALFPVRRQAGGIRTAAALHNLEAEAMGVNCRLMSGGVALEEVEIHLEANGQASWFIEDTFTATDTSDFLGSVRCTAPGNGRFTAVALEMDAANRIFTTLPVVPVDPPGSGNQQTTLDFAHFANGIGITSEMVFLNPSTQPSRPAVYFYDTEGNPIAAESVVDITGDLEITEDGALTVQTEMEPLGVLTISTHGQGELVTGSVRVVSDGPIGGLLSFDLPGVGAGVVGASLPISDAIFPVRRQEGGINTWAAIHNLESSPGLLRCDLMREGVLLDAVSIPLEANGQTSWFIDQAFPGADTSDFTGSVRCDAVGEGLFSAVALEMDSGNRIFTTLPVTEMPSQE